MPEERWSDEQLKEVRARVVRLLLAESNDGKVPPFVLVCACVQAARTLLRKYPAKMEKDLRRLVVAFLNGETSPKGVEAEQSSMLWTPDSIH